MTTSSMDMIILRTILLSTRMIIMKQKISSISIFKVVACISDGRYGL